MIEEIIKVTFDNDDFWFNITIDFTDSDSCVGKLFTPSGDRFFKSDKIIPGIEILSELVDPETVKSHNDKIARQPCYLRVSTPTPNSVGDFIFESNKYKKEIIDFDDWVPEVDEIEDNNKNTKTKFNYSSDSHFTVTANSENTEINKPYNKHTKSRQIHDEQRSIENIDVQNDYTTNYSATNNLTTNNSKPNDDYDTEIIKKHVCKYFNTPAGCYQGEYCKKEHVQIDDETGDIIEELVERFFYNMNKMALEKAKIYAQYQMFLSFSFIESPSKFWFYGYLKDNQVEETEEAGSFKNSPEMHQRRHGKKLYKMMRELRSVICGGDSFLDQDKKTQRKLDRARRMQLEKESQNVYRAFGNVIENPEIKVF